MTNRLRSALAGLVVLAVVAGTAGTAFAAAPPYEPDPASTGALTFYDASGNVITAGSTNDAPFAAYVQGSTAGRSGDTKATLFGYLPQNGVAIGAWSGEALSLSTTYPDASAPTALASSALPLVDLGSGATKLSTLVGDLPNNATDSYQGLYQLRLKTSGPGQPAGATYESADILITGTSWQVVYPAPVPASTTTTLTVAPPGTQDAGNQVTLTAAISPATAAGSVQFRDGSSNIGGPVVVASGQAQTSTSDLTVGTHSLTAEFTPTNPASNPTAFSGSTSSATSYVVNTAPAVGTSTALSINTGTATAFAPVTLTATVTPPGAPGTVTFTDGAATIGTTAAGSGTFTLTTSGLGEGAHTVTATFNPTNTASFTSSTVTGAPFSLGAPQYAPSSSNIQAEVAAGTLVISTPYTSSNVLDLGPLTLNSAATSLSASKQFAGISVTDTRAGDLPWTVSAQASPLTNGGSGTINAQDVGLTNLVADPVAGNALTAASVVTTDNPAAPAVGAGATGSQGLGGGVNHTVLHADHGTGTIAYHGTLTILAPTSSPPGTYVGTITLTVG